MKMFQSDNNSGVHPNILKAIMDANEGHEKPYGEDTYSIKAKEKIRGLFGEEVDILFVSSGTASNVIGLSGLLERYEAVVSADTAHINVDECGSFERFTGCKILYTPNKNGKIRKEDVKQFLHSQGDTHQSQPRVISISQITEIGTIYTVEEIRELANFAHEHNMLLHVDGARIANAVVALDTTFKEMITDTGVDLLSFGGTKNGMMIGEAIISLNKEKTDHLEFHRKQGMQLISKMRYISSQFLAYLEDELWKENAKNANDMGQYLLNELSKIDSIKVETGLMANMIFAYMDQDMIKILEEKFDFYVLDEETGKVRFVTSFDTSKEDIDEFMQVVKSI